MQKISLFILKLFGWKIVGHLPGLKKYIVVVAPHTSNWDLLVGLLARYAEGVRVNFMAKHQLFVFPLGALLRALGGMPINRTVKANVVDQVVALYQTQNLKLAITPEGTRGPVTRWKEGFYYIAMQAKVPIVMVGFDYLSREIRIAAPFQPSGDLASDFKIMFDYFKTIKGCYPKEIPEHQEERHKNE